jgi:cell wall-associated NlpC family hydrolase
MVRTLVLILTAASLSGCATTGATPSPFPSPGHPPLPVASAAPPAPPPSPSEAAVSAPVDAAANGTGYAIAGTALSLRGTPYRPGGTDLNGFDCSGLVHYVFARYGVAVPRTVAEQFRAGHIVSADQLEPGDLVFFATVSPDASHVGIAIGGDEFVDAPSGSGEVRVEHLSSSYWKSRFVGARRVF